MKREQILPREEEDERLFRKIHRHFAANIIERINRCLSLWLSACFILVVLENSIFLSILSALKCFFIFY